MFSITILSKRLQIDDSFLCLLSISSKFFGSIWTAFVQSDIEMYLSKYYSKIVLQKISIEMNTHCFVHFLSIRLILCLINFLYPSFPYKVIGRESGLKFGFRHTHSSSEARNCFHFTCVFYFVVFHRPSQTILAKYVIRPLPLLK